MECFQPVPQLFPVMAASFPYCSSCPLWTFPAVAVHADVGAVAADWLPTDSGRTYGTQGPGPLEPLGQTPLAERVLSNFF